MTVDPRLTQGRLAGLLCKICCDMTALQEDFHSRLFVSCPFVQTSAHPATATLVDGTLGILSMEKLYGEEGGTELSMQLLAASSESEPFLHAFRSGYEHQKSRRRTTVAALSIVICILVVTSSALGLALVHTTSRHKAAPTDFLPARNSIDLEKVLFTGSPAFYDNGTMFIEHPSVPIYTGKGCPAIDKAWDDLLFGASTYGQPSRPRLTEQADTSQSLLLKPKPPSGHLTKTTTHQSTQPTSPASTCSTPCTASTKYDELSSQIATV